MMEDVTDIRQMARHGGVRKKTMMTKGVASGDCDGGTSGSLIRRCCALLIVMLFMRELLLLFMFAVVGARVVT